MVNEKKFIELKEKLKKEIKDLDFFIGRREEINSHLSSGEEYFINFKISEIDLYIQIVLNLVSYALALLTAFFKYSYIER